MGWSVVLLLTLLVTGCASSAPTLGMRNKGGDRQILVLWHTFTGAQAQGLETLADRFNAENPWQIVLATEYQENLLQKLQIAPDSRPDLVTVWPKDLQAYVDLGMVGATPKMSPEIAAAWDDFLPMAQALYVSEGVPQAMPLGLATYLAYYNAEWLGDLGYDATMAGWEDFRRTACGATDPLRGRIGVGVPARSSILLAFLAASGSQIVGDDGTYHFADAEGRDTAAMLHAVMSGECGMVYEDWDVGVARLSKSSMALIVESSEHIDEVQRAVFGGRNFSLGISELPGPEGPGPTLWYGPGLMITAPEGERQEAALKVMSWFLSPASQRYWGETTAYLPVRRSVLQDALEGVDQSVAANSEAKLWTLALAAADRDAWVAWPPATNRIACRASLLRGLLALQQVDVDTRAYVDTAVTACNTGLVRRTPTPPPAATDEGAP